MPQTGKKTAAGSSGFLRLLPGGEANRTNHLYTRYFLEQQNNQ